jgi:cyclohexyl-isocyanide hydratase
MKIEKIAYLVFPRMTLLDHVGPNDALRRVATMVIDPNVTQRVIGTADKIVDESGNVLLPDGVYEDLAPYDLLIVPGGFIARSLVDDARLIAYLKSWGRARPIASVCTGSLLLGKAGFLEGKKATTHHTAFGILRLYAGEVVTDRRVVDEGNVVTAGGVTSGIDLGLHLVEKFWGAPAREQIARQMEWK